MQNPESKPRRNEIVGVSALYPDTFDCDEDLQEDLELCDLPGLNLGTESLASTPKDAHGWTMGALSRTKFKSTSARKAGLDRDCMICFDLAQRPSRTRCCGKLYCEAHLQDWLAGSLNRCPWCTSYCHPETGVISLASPVTPTFSSHQMGSTILHPHYGDKEIDGHSQKNEKATRSRSSSASSSSISSSSTSDSSSLDPITDQEDEDNIQAGSDVDSFHSQNLLLKLIRHFLDDPSLTTAEVYPPEIYDYPKHHVQSHEPVASQLPHTPSSTLASSQAQSFLTQSYRSEGRVVDDDELFTVASVSRMIGKVTSIVALILVFWVLTA